MCSSPLLFSDEVPIPLGYSDHAMYVPNKRMQTLQIRLRDHEHPYALALTQQYAQVRFPFSTSASTFFSLPSCEQYMLLWAGLLAPITIPPPSTSPVLQFVSARTNTALSPALARLLPLLPPPRLHLSDPTTLRPLPSLHMRPFGRRKTISQALALRRLFRDRMR